MNLFKNNINNSSFSRKLRSTISGGSLGEAVPVYKFTAGNAILSGVEIFVDVHPHPLDWLHFQNSFSYVNAQLSNQPDSAKYLPFTPPAKWVSDIRIDIEKAGRYFANSFLSFGLQYFFKQNRIFAAYNTETTTPAYTLLNASFGGDILINKITVAKIHHSYKSD